MIQSTRSRWRMLAGLAATAATIAASSALAIPAQGAAADRPAPPSARADQVAPVVGADAHGALRDRYIVVFDKGASAATVRAARADVERRGASVSHVYQHALRGFSATLPQAAIEALRRNPAVSYIEVDRTVSLSATQSPATWGLDRIDQRSLPLNNSYTYNATGQGVRAYIIDTGILGTHQEFSGRVSGGYTAISDGRGTTDCNGHGTHVAGTVGGTTYGVAKQVTLVPVRVLNCSGSGTNSGVIAGVDWVTGNASRPAVANMSLGGGASTALDNAVSNSISSGVTYAIAAGNDSANACNYSPARVAAAITVGSTTSSDERSSFSNYGTCLDIFAPGSSITSAWYTSNTATNTISGTSMATPHVAGVAALYLQGSPSASPSTVRNAIVSSGTTGVVSSPGSGSPNVLLYSLLTGGGDPPPPPPPTGCSAYPEVYSGSLSGSGDSDVHPNGTYYYSSAGTHQGCLSGPSGTDFDLYLYRWNGFSWSVVARSISSSSEESITYNGTSGYYYWSVRSYSGSGSYTFGMQRP